MLGLADTKTVQHKSIMENALIPSLEKHIQELEEKTNKQKKEITNLKNLIDLLQTALEKKSKEWIEF